MGNEKVIARYRRAFVMRDVNGYVNHCVIACRQRLIVADQVRNM
jgi:hypothetical protein